MPRDDRALAVTKGTWTRSADAGAFLGTVSTSTKKGATLSTTITNASSLALVAKTGKKGGSVQVFLNGHLLRTISLRGAAANQVVIPVATFSSPQSGTVTIVNSSGKSHKHHSGKPHMNGKPQKNGQKVVVVDGLGVVSAS